MASYEDLRPLLTDSQLLNKTVVAIGVAADTIRQELLTVPNHSNRLLWAKQAYQDPIRVASRMLWAVIIANRQFTVAQIKSAADTTLQASVDSLVDLFANGQPV